MPFLKSSSLLKTIKSAVVREYSSNARKSLMTAERAKEISTKIAVEFRSHRANRHEFFDYLEELSKRGMTPEQFMVYRDNFFYRTTNTILSVATHAKKAVYNHDYQALAEVAKNFADEGGHGILEGVHLKLLEDGHNLHGRKVFGVPEITIPNAKNSPFLIEEALMFRKNQERLFRSSYPTMTGCLLAHEGAADRMLENFKKFIFDPYKGYYSPKEFQRLIEYYTVHRDDDKINGNVEEQHEEQALNIASKIIQYTPRAEKLMLEGGIKFLDAQSNLWDGFMMAIENSQFHGQIVCPKSEFLKEDSDRPSFAVDAVLTKKMTTGQIKSKDEGKLSLATNASAKR